MDRFSNNKHIGRKCGVLEILSVSHREDKYYMYNVLCDRCKRISLIKGNCITHSYKSCKLCKNDLHSKIHDAKFLELRKYRKIYNSYKGNAKIKNTYFDLTIKDIQFFVDSNCYYCNSENSSGIDKVDPKDGYCLRNCVPCCTMCNFMKNKFSIYEFFNKIDLIYNNHLKD